MATDWSVIETSRLRHRSKGRALHLLARAPDLIERPLERQRVEVLEPQTDEDADSRIEFREILLKNGRCLSSEPAKAAGSSTPQCAVIGWPHRRSEHSAMMLRLIIETNGTPRVLRRRHGFVTE
jgi:hypothetical protein